MYKINYKGFLLSYLFTVLILLIGILGTLNSLKNRDYFVIITFIILLYGLAKLMLLIKKIFNLKYLSNDGELISGLPYKAIPIFAIFFRGVGSGTVCLKVNYQTKEGKVVKLKSIKIFPYDMIKNNKTVDLLIDPGNLKRFYIDFNIKKIRGAKDE